jgi:ribosomal protein L12E/L44/L45/RPP1/RPP2
MISESRPSTTKPWPHASLRASTRSTSPWALSAHSSLPSSASCREQEEVEEVEEEEVEEEEEEEEDPRMGGP